VINVDVTDLHTITFWEKQSHNGRPDLFGQRYPRPTEHLTARNDGLATLIDYTYSYGGYMLWHVTKYFSKRVLFLVCCNAKSWPRLIGMLYVSHLVTNIIWFTEVTNIRQYILACLQRWPIIIAYLPRWPIAVSSGFVSYCLTMNCEPMPAQTLPFLSGIHVVAVSSFHRTTREFKQISKRSMNITQLCNENVLQQTRKKAYI
jgi:hypothetical protein